MLVEGDPHRRMVTMAERSAKHKGCVSTERYADERCHVERKGLGRSIQERSRWWREKDWGDYTGEVSMVERKGLGRSIQERGLVGTE